MRALLITGFLFVSLVSQAQKGIITVTGGKAPEGTERRLALVIGNRDYKYVRKLKNPVNDAEDMSRALKILGFEVITVPDADYRTMMNALNQFRERLTATDVALLYFSGHGLGFGGQSYLLPTDADLTCLEQIETHGIGLNRILSDIRSRQVRNSFVLLDACRNLPKLKYCESAKKDVDAPAGLVRPTNNPPGSMVVYATEEGSWADDNAGGRNGLFTEALLRYLTVPNLSIRAILDKADADVDRKSNGQQSPGRYDKMRGDFVFVQTVTPAPAREEPKPEPVKPTPTPVIDLPVGPAMVHVKGGSFQMGSTEGSDSEKPVHTVRVSDFLMGKYEVTVGEFAEFVEATTYKTDAEKGDGSYIWNGKEWTKKAGVSWRCDAEGKVRDRSSYRHPVIHVSHNDAVAYCEWLTKKNRKAYRLPTEAEWEYAAGGGSVHTKYSWGNSEPVGKGVGNLADKSTIGMLLWAVSTYDDGYRFTAPVGSYAPNELGLYDMSGNVWEWCSDWYGSDYYASSTNSVNPTGPTTGTYRVLRGGGWGSGPQNCRVAYRNYGTPTYRNYNVGFRVVSQLQ